jgi:hypothetical protein
MPYQCRCGTTLASFTAQGNHSWSAQAENVLTIPSRTTEHKLRFCFPIVCDETTSALLFSLTLIPQLTAAATPPAHVVMAYGLMPEPGKPTFRLTTQQAKQLSHLNMAFLTLNAQGECVTETPLSKKDLQAQQTARQAARRDNPSLRILLSVGGWAQQR